MLSYGDVNFHPERQEPALDKRSRKTQEAIVRAYEELTREKGSIREVSVQDIAKRAGISRSTFYSHFRDLTELSRKMEEEFADHLADIIRTQLQAGGYSMNDEILENLFLAVIHYILSQDIFAREILLNDITDIVADTLAEKISNQLSLCCTPEHAEKNQPALKNISMFLTCGTAGIMKRWFSAKHPVSPEDLALSLA